MSFSSILSFLAPSPVAQGLSALVAGLVVHFAPILWNAVVAGKNAAVASVQSQTNTPPKA
jgi:hypothetical protein